MPPESYAKAGVDLHRVGRIHRSVAALFEPTFRFGPRKVGTPLVSIGHYAGLIDIGHGDALAMHTDGVGTKVLVAQELGRFDTVGIDCIAMTVNDLLCLGARPLALLDYIALEKENEELVAKLGKGLVEGARLASAPIVGGETAILGDVIRGKAGLGFDLASMGVGVVRRDKVIDGSRVCEGDVVIGVRSSGLHSNGYTLARKVLRKFPLKERVKELGSTLGDALLRPTLIYVKPTLKAIRKFETHGIAHITGGSFAKLSRLTGRRDLMFDITLPPPPPIFGLIQREGGISDREMLRTFNMGVGLCLCMPGAEAGACIRLFGSHGFDALRIGTVKRGKGVRVNGVRVS